MRRIVTLLAALAVAVIGFAPAAGASSVCYDVYVQVNDQSVSQADCVEV